MFATCFLSVIPIRASPSDKAEMISQVLYGETFDILEKQEKWSKIRLHHDKYEGWVDNKQYKLIQEKGIRKKVGLRITAPVKRLKTPEGMQVLSMGAVHPAARPTERTLLKTALQLLNTPYLWGGRTPFGIDCSGFTQLVFSIHGMQLKRDAYQQAAQGRKINIESAATGDLAFFSNAEGRITHVGIVVREKNSTAIVHASGKVRKDLLDKHGIFNQETAAYSHQLHSIKRILHA
jgi:gamma-D-glutamyl-L-lysine dipeptidyl-peptidase